MGCSPIPSPALMRGHLATRLALWGEEEGRGREGEGGGRREREGGEGREVGRDGGKREKQMTREGDRLCTHSIPELPLAAVWRRWC